MHSLAWRIAGVLLLLAGLAALPSCGDEEKTMYIKPFAPLAPLKAGLQVDVVLYLSVAPKDKTYIDMEVSGGDKQYLTLDPPEYIIVPAEKDTASVRVTAKTPPARMPVTIRFRIRNTQEYRDLTFEITP